MLSVVLALLLTYGVKKKNAFRIFSFFIVLTLAATLSRSSWIALVPMVMALLYFSKRKLPIIAALIAILIVAPFIMPKSVKERVAFTFTQPKESGQVTVGNVRLDTSTSGRLESWRDVLEEDFYNHPIRATASRGIASLTRNIRVCLPRRACSDSSPFSCFFFPST